MRRGQYVDKLRRVLGAYPLVDRHPEELEHVVFMLEQGAITDHEAMAYLLMAQDWIDELERRPNLLPMAPDEHELGAFDIELGELIERPGVPAGIRLLDKPRHVMISAATGAGKSCLIKSIIHGINRLNRTGPHFISILGFDFKGDLAHVADELGRDLWDHYSFHQGLRIGLNSPAGSLPPSAWINQATKVLAARCGLVMSRSCLAAMMRFALAALNPSPVPRLVWPSIPLLYDIARYAPLDVFAAKQDYGKTLLQVLDDLVDSSSGVFNTFGGLEVVQHVTKPQRCAIIDMTAVSPVLCNLIVDLIASQLLYSRLFERHTVDTTEVVLVFDESDHICSARASSVYPEDYSPPAEISKKGTL